MMAIPEETFAYLVRVKNAAKAFIAVDTNPLEVTDSEIQRLRTLINDLKIALTDD